MVLFLILLPAYIRTYVGVPLDGIRFTSGNFPQWRLDSTQFYLFQITPGSFDASELSLLAADQDYSTQVPVARSEMHSLAP